MDRKGGQNRRLVQKRCKGAVKKLETRLKLVAAEKGEKDALTFDALRVGSDTPLALEVQSADSNVTG